MAGPIIFEVRQEFEADPEKYIAKLQKISDERPQNIDCLADLAEAQFEIGAAEQALQNLKQIFKIDKNAKENAKVFLWAGQLFGGRNGVAFYNRAVQILQLKLETLDSIDFTEIRMQISQACLGMIEIWMTDLCMEPEAEQECERLIKLALSTCDADPEAYSVLGSIRLSQLRTEDAKPALIESWERFLNGINNGTVDNSAIPKLIRLAQSMAETMQINEMLQVAQAILQLDDMVPECYYLIALGHNLLLSNKMPDLEASIHIVCAKDAADALIKLRDDPLNEEGVDQALLDAVEQIKRDLPPPVYENPFEQIEKEELDEQLSYEQQQDTLMEEPTAEKADVGA